MAKAKKDTTENEERSWRELDQKINPRTLSAQGRKRFALAAVQYAMVAFLVGVAGWGAYEIFDSSSGGSSLSDLTQAAPLREVVLVNDADGVLDQNWLERVIDVRLGTPLMEVDLHALRARLLATPQVRAVELRRDFPGTLTIALRERIPVARIHVRERTGRTGTLLVSSDGVVFAGQGYDSARLSYLPFLDGVRLSRNGHGGYRPLAGMDDVADLLQSVQNSAPQLFADWKVVNLSRLSLYDEIIVKSRTIPEIVLSRRMDFTQQLARLDYIADYARTRPEAVVQRVDLSLGSDVPVAFDSPSRLLPPSFVKPSKSRTRRDL